MLKPSLSDLKVYNLILWIVLELYSLILHIHDILPELSLESYSSRSQKRQAVELVTTISCVCYDGKEKLHGDSS